MADPELVMPWNKNKVMAELTKVAGKEMMIANHHSFLKVSAA